MMLAVEVLFISRDFLGQRLISFPSFSSHNGAPSGLKHAILASDNVHVRVSPPAECPTRGGHRSEQRSMFK